MNEIINIDHNGKILIEANFVGADFVLIFHTATPVLITKESNNSLYSSLIKILNNDYEFDNNGLSYQRKNEICWFSDQYCNIEDETQTDKVSRLFIKESKSTVELSVSNPYLKENNIHGKNYIISFSPSGNGFYSRNKDTGTTFQDDIIVSFKANNMKIENKNKIYSKTNKC